MDLTNFSIFFIEIDIIPWDTHSNITYSFNATHDFNTIYPFSQRCGASPSTDSAQQSLGQTTISFTAKTYYMYKTWYVTTDVEQLKRRGE